MKTSLRTHTCGELSKKQDGEEVTLSGWVDSVRIGGKIGFLDIRDRYGKTQVFLNKDLAHNFRNLNKEDVIQVYGVVKARPENQVKEAGTGEIEISASSLTILKEVPELPIDLDEHIESSEATRMKYRYLDLRRKDMQDNLLIRHKMVKAIRDFFDKEQFLEVETPILAKSTPEGARDYLVPSRTFPGKFFALPQSPQTFKQLLMVSGFDRYFQIARCFRDEDLRADRQPEFTQLDLEMSFIDEEDIYSVMEKMVQYVFKEVLNRDIRIPFPRMTYEESMKQYKNDRPDMRKEYDTDFALLWVTDFPMYEFSETENRFLSMHHPFTSPVEEDMKYLHSDKARVRSRAYDLVLNGNEIGGGSIRIHDSKIQQEVFDSLGIGEKEAEEKFGFLLNALRFAPPHGGIAFGLDRWAMLLAGRNSIREVIAFPKNQEAKDLMLDSPSAVKDDQLHELGVFIYEE
jgi:aspartyl-tRNA synthetase